MITVGSESTQMESTTQLGHYGVFLPYNKYEILCEVYW